MLKVYILNLIYEPWQDQLPSLEYELQCKIAVNQQFADKGDIERILRYAEEERFDALICSWSDYDTVISHQPLISVYPMDRREFDTPVILYFLQKELREKGLGNLRRVVLGTKLVINVRLELLEEMFGFELLQPRWEDVLPQSYFDTLRQEGYEVVVCRRDYADMVRKSGMYPFFSDAVFTYTDFSQDMKRVMRQVAEGSQLKATLKTMENMLNYSFEAMCTLDKFGNVTAYNEQAAGIFVPPGERSYLGRNFSELVPAVPTSELNMLLSSGKSVFSRIIEANNSVGMLSITPNTDKNNYDGAVVHFTTIQKIDEIETQIKSEMYMKGHVARYHFEDIVGQSEAMLRVRYQAERFSKYNSTILLCGESGCGKELFAQGIHNNSMRKRQPFVAVNCGSLPTNLLESELFGYVDGAFTGALKKGKKGLFEIADKGTIFLDEITEMDMQGQSRLLRVLEEREIMRVGGDRVIPVDVRVIAATNRDMEKLVSEGKFREDLYYRLNVLTLVIPPLRERGDDVVLLAQSFLQKFGKRYKKLVSLTPEAEICLQRQPWKGNVRQLRNFCERLVILADDRHIDGDMICKELVNASPWPAPAPATIPEKLEEDVSDERQDILDALEKAGDSRENAAQILGISKTTLWRRMKKYRIL